MNCLGAKKPHFILQGLDSEVVPVGSGAISIVSSAILATDVAAEPPEHELEIPQ
jgi:hypothetical protein